MSQNKDRMLQFFKFDHLPPALRVVSEPFCKLAHEVVENLPSNPERTAALRKLLEAKDAAVRALIYQDEKSEQAARELTQLLREPQVAKAISELELNQKLRSEPLPDPQSNVVFHRSALDHFTAHQREDKDA